jgi:hypothetical protein
VTLTTVAAGTTHKRSKDDQVHAMKPCSKTRGVAPLHLALDGDVWSASRPSRLSPEKKPRCLLNRWLGPTARLAVSEKRKLSCPCWTSKPGPSSLQLRPISRLSTTSGDNLRAERCYNVVWYETAQLKA